MPEFAVDGVKYRLRRLNAVEEWRLYVHFQPMLHVLAGLEQGIRAGTVGGQSLAATLHPLLAVDDEALSTLIDACRDSCEQDVNGTWGQVGIDLPMHSLITFVMEAAGAALADFFALKRSEFRPLSREGAGFEPVSMPNNEQWLWRPCVEGHMCLEESYYNGTLTLARIAKMNDVMDVREENEYRARKAAERAAEQARR